jgi:hypothetical protein
MCLFAHEGFTREAKRRRKGIVTRYKVLARCAKTNKETLGLYSIYYIKEYKPGWNNSNRKGNAGVIRYSATEYEIERGIHVYTTKEIARKAELVDGYRLIVPVRCHVDDLLGVSGSKNREAYKRVFVTDSAYKTAMKEKLKRARRR